MSCCYPTGQAVHVPSCATFTEASRTICTSKIVNAAVLVLLNDYKCFLLLLCLVLNFNNNIFCTSKEVQFWF